MIWKFLSAVAGYPARVRAAWIEARLDYAAKRECYVSEQAGLSLDEKRMDAERRLSRGLFEKPAWTERCVAGFYRAAWIFTFLGDYLEDQEKISRHRATGRAIATLDRGGG